MEISYCLILFFLPICVSSHFSLSPPVNYCEEEHKTESCQSNVTLYVNRLNSEKTLIPYEESHFDFCNAGDNDSPVENLIQVVLGDRIRPSMHTISFLKDKQCANLCQKNYHMDKKEDVDKLNTLKKGILKNYQHHWIIDNMPISWCYLVYDDQHFCSTSFPMGCYVNAVRQPKDACIMNSAFSQADTFYLFNHVDINIRYHSGVSESWGVGFKDHGGRIVQVKIRPRSIKHQPGKNCETDLPPMDVPNNLKPSEVVTVNYTYSVFFLKDNTVKWSSRWDYLLDSTHSNIQWFSIINSLVVILFLAGLLVRILLRRLRKDIAHSNKLESVGDEQNKVGWKSVQEDVFLPPRCGMLLSIFLGSGVQIYFMTLITLFLAWLGLLSPANRGALMTCAMVSYVCFGAPAGYVSAKMYKAFGGEKWKSNAFLTVTVCPGCAFCLFFVMNLVYWAKGSSAAIPFTTLAVLLALWFGISLPLTFVGAYFVFKNQAIEQPVQTSYIPRQIPKQSICTQPISGIIMGGILPFGCIFIQLFFILNSIWSNETYYMFGFLFLVFTILVIICSETTILLCFVHLRAEDYHWWWRSFLTSGFVAFYVFLYCVYYFLTKLVISDGISTFLYFGYMMIMAFLLFLLTGTVGFFACFWFVRKIYSGFN